MTVTRQRRNSRSDILAPFEIRGFRFQFPADLFTSWGNEMEVLILGWYILTATGSVLLLTVYGALQYGGAEAIYNWNCCGLTVGYRRFALGSLRNEGEWLWGFTLSGLGTAGNIRRSTSVFPATDVLRRMY